MNKIERFALFNQNKKKSQLITKNIQFKVAQF